MYTINIDNTIVNQSFDDLQIRQLVKKPRFEVLSISLAKNVVFPPHESNEDAHLIMLQGQIIFYIEGNPINLTEQQELSFPKHTEHWVEAMEDSKFLIIR
jgi:quercetin dioxygenase-like cupin family protein